MLALTDFLERHPSTTRLGLAAIAASAITAASLLGYQTLERRRRERTFRNEKIQVIGHPVHHDIFSPTFPEERDASANDQFAPTRQYLGAKAFTNVQNAFVIVVGAGGVGSWATLTLLRAGVKRIRIIDFDQTSLSSLNRHAVATLEDVGRPKVVAMKEHCQRIAPHAEIDIVNGLFNAESASKLLGGNPDYVVDAIDNIDTKIELIKYCVDHSIKMISSMGAGAKADPSRVQIADITETDEDRLARSVRQRLKKLNITTGVTVVYSSEKPNDVKLKPLDESQVSDAHEFAPSEGFRSRILPVLGMVPSMFGISIAAHIILCLADYPEYTPLPNKLRGGLYSSILKKLVVTEEKHYKVHCPFNDHDIQYLIEELWLGKSVLSKSQDRLAITRWDRTQPLSRWNAVCMTRSEVEKHAALPPNTDMRVHYGQEIYDNVTKRIGEEKNRCVPWDKVL